MGPHPRKCTSTHTPPSPRPPPRPAAQVLTLISAGVMRRLVGRCLTVAALESASAMSGLSVGSVAAARISSSFSAQPRRCLFSHRGLAVPFSPQGRTPVLLRPPQPLPRACFGTRMGPLTHQNPDPAPACLSILGAVPGNPRNPRKRPTDHWGEDPDEV